MKTTIRDVAEAAGVSAMAVSKVLHGTGQNVRVSDETSELIKKVAHELRYQPNHLARSLRSRRTKMIGVVFQHFERLSEQNPYYPQLLNGVMAALFPADYTLALCPKLVQHSEEGAISDGRFDGILWCRPDFTASSVEGIRHSSIPVVMMHAPPGSASGIPTFCVNNPGALRLVVEHLVRLGHKRIGFVIDPVNEHTAEGRTRVSAFRDAMDEVGLKGDVLVWDYDCAGLEAYASDDAPHTALACFSDTLAGHLLAACQRLRIRVPEDLSIVGFDSSSFCESTTPRLTSVFQPVERIARDATTYLLGLISEQGKGNQGLLPVSSLYDCSLDVRDSTSRPSPKRIHT
ncbi:MAG TPA: LacI family DNA-binding transcriptional regulator [Fimbriimonadaceae bacterium]|nr:LacI family DNA-binding transcriptional regulator [Fimbriimonadaceae bacterium]